MRKTMVTSEPIVLGKVGENEVNKVLFPVRGWKELYGDGEFGLVVQLPSENDPYPVPVAVSDDDYRLNGEFVEWIVESSDLLYPGRGKCELRYSVAIPDTTPVEYKRVKSVVYDTIIWDALGTNSLEPPEPWQPWIDDVEDKAVRAEDAAEYAEDAKDAAEDARDDAKDYRDEAQEYASDAEGYKNDAQTAAQNAQGAVSTAFGQITATATTLSPGSSATASFDTSTKVMSFGIPKGDPGTGATDLKEIPLTYSGGQYWIASADDGKWIVDNTPAVNGEAIIIQPFVLRAGSRVFYPVGISVNGGGARGLTAVCHDYNIMLPNGTFREMLYSCSLSAAGVCSTPGYERRALETEGKITIGASMYSAGTKYAVERKALAITENGVTTTYYVADITNT